MKTTRRGFIKNALATLAFLLLPMRRKIKPKYFFGYDGRIEIFPHEAATDLKVELGQCLAPTIMEAAEAMDQFCILVKRQNPLHIMPHFGISAEQIQERIDELS